VARDDFDSDDLRWMDAILQADKWRPHERFSSAKLTGDLRPLAKLFRDRIPISAIISGFLADLFERHRLSSISNKTPVYTKSDKQISAMALQEEVDEFKKHIRWKGPITKPEMEEAVRHSKRRAKKAGRANVTVDAKQAAVRLREELISRAARYYGYRPKEFRNALEGKAGTINRLGKGQPDKKTR
jgi:hypothetical protein